MFWCVTVCRLPNLWVMGTITPPSNHWFLAGCAQNIPRLDIQFIPNFGYLLAHNVIKLDSLFDFLDGMNSGSVVFAP